MRFDCSHWKHRVVVAGPRRSILASWNSSQLRTCCRSAGRASAAGAATGRPQRTMCASVTAVAGVATDPTKIVGRRSVLRW